jgi:hypothetical protein
MESAILLFSGYRIYFAGAKRPGPEANESPPQLALRLRMSEAIHLLPLRLTYLWRGQSQAYFLIIDVFWHHADTE